MGPTMVLRRRHPVRTQLCIASTRGVLEYLLAHADFLIALDRWPTHAPGVSRSP
jgi:hypothetical protein